VGHVACTGNKERVWKNLLQKPGKKKILERPKCKWENYIKMCLEIV
jgi:hypothetical protein